jgi:hypothetical protein
LEEKIIAKADGMKAKRVNYPIDIDIKFKKGILWKTKNIE